MRTVLILLHALGYAGRSGAALDQCRMFVDMGLKPVIVTFKYEPRFEEGLASREGDIVLPEGSSAINIYRDMRAPLTKDSHADWSRAEDEDTHGLTWSTSTNGDTTRIEYFDLSGRLVKHRELRDDEPLRTVLYRDGKPSVQREYEDTGACGRELSLDPVTGNVSEERYFTPDGICYVTRHLDPESGRQLGVYCHDPSTGRSTRYAHNIPWHAAWLTKILEESQPRPLAIAQHPTAMRKLLDTDPKLSSRLFLAHVNQFQPPYTLGSPIREDYVKPFERVSEMPVVLALTAKQAADYRATFGAENCDPIVIPNVIRDRRSSTSIRKVRGRVGVVCRLHAEQKRVDDLLRAWVQVVAAVPAAHLEIGGDGGARRSLEQLASELGLQESVTFHGWVPDGADLMASCILTASAARWEGLPLSIGESLAAETPVVAYDINYGPSDLIRDGKDGLLVPDGDVDGLAQGIIRLLKHPRSAAKMGRSASRRMAEEFSMESIAPKWKAAFQIADQRS